MLPPHGVTVLWDWEWTHDQDGDGDISGEGDPESQEQNNPYLHSDVESDLQIYRPVMKLRSYS